MDCVPRTPALAEANPIPIAQLSPAVEDQKQRYFRGAVVLLWPYSSSTKEFRVLLSEPDFRLRSSHGQVRVTFQGSNAEAVAKSQIGIGDTVLLGLDGVKWEKKKDDVQAFTGEVDWCLTYRNRVVLEIYRGSKLFGTVDIDSVPQEGEDDDGVSCDTPMVTTSPKSLPAPSQNRQAPSVSQTALSPFRLDDSSIFGYTEEEDGYIFGKGRKRTKFGRPSSEWVFVDSPPSPLKETSNWSTDEFEFEAGEDEDIPHQADVHVTSPTPSAQPIEDGTKADDYETPALSSLSEGDESDLHLRPHIPRQHEEPVASEQVDGRAAATAPDHRNFGDSEETMVGKSSEVESIEDSMKTPTPELASHATLPPTASPIQDGPELATPAEVIDRHDAQETIGSGISYFGTGVELEGEDQAQHRVDESESLETLLQPLMAAEDVVRNKPLLSGTDVETPALSNVISDLPQQALDSEVPSAELEGDTQGLDLYEDVPTQDYGIDDEPREAWGEGLARERLATVASFDPEDGMDGHLEASAEEHMPEMGEMEESPSDLEADEDDSISSIVEEGTPRPTAAKASVQPEVIVIDSDDESQVSSASSDVSDNLPHTHGIPSPNQRAADISDEQFDHDKARHDSPSADATFDDRMVGVSSQDDRDKDHSQRDAVGAARHLGLDGCMEYEPSSDHPPLVSTISKNQTRERKVRRSPPPPLVPVDISSSAEMESGQQHLRSWSIPVRTISNQLQKSRWPRTLHADSQMMTPGNTQETVRSKSREASPPSPTTQNLLTPQLSQNSRSVTSTIDTSDMEMPFEDDKTESPVDKDVTPLGSFVSRPTPEQKADPLATGALIEQTDGYPNEVPSASPESRKRSTEAFEPPSQVSGGPSVEEVTAAEKQHVSSQLSCPVGELQPRLAYFCPLSLLSENLNSTVDTMSIVASAMPVLRGTRKPRDYFTTMYLLDPSTAGSTVCAQLFRKQKDALPVAAKGDVILLRNFKVRRVDEKETLCTVGHSSWAVFVQGDEKKVQIKGPSVKYGEGERNCVTELRQWYNEEGAELIEKSESLQANRECTQTNGAMGDSAAGPRDNERNMVRKYRRTRNSTGRRLTVHHLRHGRRYTDSPASKNIHKLRDGTLYAHL